MRALPLLVGAAAAAPVAPAAPLTLLKSSDARCMDGTQAGYYHQPATSASAAQKWVFHFQGGGECTSQDMCEGKLSGPLGSSKYFDDSIQPYQLASSDPDQNPSLYAWHHVFVPYCTQDLYSGTVSKPTQATWGLYFTGHLTVKAIVEDLKGKGLGNATDVVLSGASAGGIGVWINLDWMQKELPAATVVGAPIAGFYFYAYPYTGPGHTQSTLADFRPPAWPAHVALWQSFLPEACAAALGDGKAACMLSNYSAPFVKARVFVTEAQTDAVQLDAHDWVPRSGVKHRDPDVIEYVKAWKANQTQGMLAVLKSADGWFNPACYIHTKFSNDEPLIDGKSYANAFGEWFGGRHVRLMDDCGVLCGNCP
eukprot:TRINITY_DN35539_c0_g1_i1.p2 TRINITY_DN35539_c0_g1~~TRINITY_DN35539_c0_g1_i1.p2  ORF type:complete len:367 (+),score=108.38 TRINITY_DN35539_c0_g1_i1:102-1202(+)